MPKSIGRPNVFERDIDALIERKLKSDPKFAKNFIGVIIKQCETSVIYEKQGVDRQVPHEGTRGTIDLLIHLFDKQSGEIGRILVENKLDSGFTPDQPERYASSAVAMSRFGRPAIATICAPADYLKKSKYLGPFMTRVSYEEMAAWLDGDDQSLLSAAILRFSMPYEPDPDPKVRSFHEGYRRLVEEIASELIVKPNPNPNGKRPEHSRTIYFVARNSLPRWDFLPTLRFSHQCWDSSAPSPSVKVMFDGWAAHEALLHQKSAALGNTRLHLRKAGRSLGLVHNTPRMDNKRPVGDQLDAVKTGIRAAAAIRAWMYANEGTLRDWASLVANAQARAPSAPSSE